MRALLPSFAFLSRGALTCGLAVMACTSDPAGDTDSSESGDASTTQTGDSVSSSEDSGDGDSASATTAATSVTDTSDDGESETGGAGDGESGDGDSGDGDGDAGDGDGDGDAGDGDGDAGDGDGDAGDGDGDGDAGDGDGDGDGQPPGVFYKGVNLAGAEFGTNFPGTLNTDFFYPTASEVEYFVGKGMNTIRFPFKWERLQPTLGADFDTAEFQRLQDFVAAVKAEGAYVILDPHNYARYQDNSGLHLIGSNEVSVDDYRDLWRRLAETYADDPQVIFGLMNEPRDMPTEDWLTAANAGIAAIRGAGADNLIFVPGNAWTGAHSWSQDWYGSPNATVMQSIVDPADNYAIEVHQYFDADFSGTDPGCQSSTIGSEAIAGFTTWARAQGVRAFLGEFAGGNNPTCQAAITDVLSTLAEDDDVWLGWSWWAAGPQWGNYFFSIEPTNGDAPQMAWLTPYL